MVNITVVRRFLKGKTHKRGATETRGRKRTFTRRNVLHMNSVRKGRIKKSKGARQATWDVIRRAARAQTADPTTVARAFQREGIDVKLRRSREKPERTDQEEQEREEVCGKMRRWPLHKFTDGLDMIIDCKKFPAPATPGARQHLAKQKVVAQLRTRGEGLKKHFTKPSAANKHRKGCASVHVLAGISNGRIVLWEYYNRWSGKTAAEMYEGPLLKTLKKQRGEKPSYLIAEDNDPSGFKSSKGMAAKKRAKIKTIKWPRYSPDLMPLDFSLWDDISNRMQSTAPRGRESKEAFKVRLRRMALRTSHKTVVAAVEAMRTRAKQIWEAKGGNIARD